MTSFPGDPERQGLAGSIRRLFPGAPRGAGESSEPPEGHLVLREAVRACLESAPADRSGALERVVRAAEGARRRRRLEPLADAAETLARFGADEPRVLEVARSLVSPGVATVLVERVGRVGDDPHRLRELVEALPLLGGEVELALLEWLRREARDPGAERSVRRDYLAVVEAVGRRDGRILGRMASDRDWRVVRNAVRIAGEVGGRDAHPLLIEAGGHPDSRVRREALVALSRLGAEEAAVLAADLLRDTDPAVRAQAVRSVTALNPPGALAMIRTLLEGESDAAVMVEVVRSLGALGGASVVGELERRAAPSRFRRSQPKVRVAAYRALAAIGTPRAEALLREAAEDRDPDVRREVRRLRAQDRTGPKPGT